MIVTSLSPRLGVQTIKKTPCGKAIRKSSQAADVISLPSYRNQIYVQSTTCVVYVSVFNFTFVIVTDQRRKCQVNYGDKNCNLGVELLYLILTDRSTTATERENKGNFDRERTFCPRVSGGEPA